jgi:hypothetical protein
MDSRGQVRLGRTPPPVSDSQIPGHPEGVLYCAVRAFDPFRVG